jgi:peptide deformylase
VSVREIVTAGHPALRRPARELSLEDLRSPQIQALIDDLIETRRAAGGAGLAANQIDARVRIAVIEVDERTRERYPYKPPVELTVIVNPVIEALDPETFAVNEGCLSVPGLRGELERHLNIRVRYLDRHGEAREERRRGLTAGTFQHELDHLDGILFFDRVRDPRTLMTWESFERFHREQFEARARGLVARVGS